MRKSTNMRSNRNPQPLPRIKRRAMTFDRALAKPLIEIVSRNDEQGVFQVRVGAIATVVTIKLFALEDGRYLTTQDYAIKAGGQAGPYEVRYTPCVIPGDALDNAISTYSFYYKLALRHGYKPDSSWLVPLQ
jgi:hypothetical protein